MTLTDLALTQFRHTAVTASLHTYMYVNVDIDTNTHTHTKHTDTYANTHTHTHTHTHTRTHMHTSTNARMHTHMTDQLFCLDVRVWTLDSLYIHDTHKHFAVTINTQTNLIPPLDS